MATAVATTQPATLPAVQTNGALVMGQEPGIDLFSRERVDLLKKTYGAELTDLEFDLLIYLGKRTSLDPLMGQLYAIKYGDKATYQTSIDGYCAIAARSGAFAGIEDVVFDVEDAGHPNRATATVYRMVNGMRCPFTATARWNEYVRVERSGQVGGRWRQMPFNMLGKCALAKALRIAFPIDLSGLYVDAEMEQAQNETPVPRPVPASGRRVPPAPVPQGRQAPPNSPGPLPQRRATQAPADPAAEVRRLGAAIQRYLTARGWDKHDTAELISEQVSGKAALEDMHALYDAVQTGLYDKVPGTEAPPPTIAPAEVIDTTTGELQVVVDDPGDYRDPFEDQ